MTSVPRPSRFEARIELPAEPEQIAHARRFVRHTFDRCPPDLVADLTLIVSELVTNAVEHGSGEHVVVEAGLTTDQAVLRVESVGPAPDVPDVACWAVGACSGTNGRGLGIIAQLATTVEVERTPTTFTTVVTRAR